MNRIDFKSFVSGTLPAVIAAAEQVTGRKYPGEPALRWYPSPELIIGDLAEAITDRVYLNQSSIYPCVDIGVCEILPGGQPVVYAIVSGHDPAPFGTNWTGRQGPFVYIVGAGIRQKAQMSEKKGLAFTVIMPDGQGRSGT